MTNQDVATHYVKKWIDNQLDGSVPKVLRDGESINIRTGYNQHDEFGAIVDVKAGTFWISKAGKHFDIATINRSN